MSIIKIPLEQLVPSKANMRPINQNDDLSDLIDSIRSQGILNPILVRPSNNHKTYEVYAGHRRFQAAKELKLSEVSCLVSEITDIEAQVRSLIENYQRLEPGYYEKIKTFHRLYQNLEEFDTTGITAWSKEGVLPLTRSQTNRLDSLCSLVGVKSKTLKRYLKLAVLPDSVLKLLDSEEDKAFHITLKNAELLLSVPEDCLTELVETIAESVLSNPEMEMVIRCFIKTPKLELVPEFINDALDKSQQKRKQKTTSNNEDAPLTEARLPPNKPDADADVGAGVGDDVVGDDAGVDAGVDSNNAKDAAITSADGVTEQPKVNKKDPWLYDRKNKPHSIPPEQSGIFWDLYEKINKLTT